MQRYKHWSTIPYVLQLLDGVMKRKIKLDWDFWLHSDFSTSFWKECESTRESSPHLICPCISKTQNKNTAIYKLMHYLWPKVSRGDSSAQQGRPSMHEALWVRQQIWDTELGGGSFLVSSCSFCSWAFFPSLLLPLLSLAHSKCQLSASGA